MAERGEGGGAGEFCIMGDVQAAYSYFLIRERPTEAYFADSNISLNIQMGNLSVATKSPLLVGTL